MRKVKFPCENCITLPICRGQIVTKSGGLVHFVLCDKCPSYSEYLNYAFSTSKKKYEELIYFWLNVG